MNAKETLPLVVLMHGINMPEKTAICSGNQQVSYSELAKKVMGAEDVLLRLGVKHGDKIVLSAAMKWEYIAAFLAVKLIRAVAVPVLNTASAKEVSYIIERTGALHFFSDSPKYSEIGMVRPYKELFDSGIVDKKNIEKYYQELIPDEELSEILFTSGTTGNPKGVMLSQKGLKASIYNTSVGMNMSADDVLMLPLPLNHSFGLRVLRSALYHGETIVLQNGFSFAAEIINKIQEYNCNCMVAVVSGFQMLLEQMGDTYKNVFGDMKYIEFSAGAVPIPMRKKLIVDLPDVKLYNTWGSTETGGGLFICFSDRKDKITSAGVAINDIFLGIEVNGKIQTKLYNVYGRLAIQSSAMMLGYYKDEQLTQQAFSGTWLLTNDCALMDNDGYIYLNGRIDDLISIGGEKIAPNAVEKIVQGYEGVIDCACIGVDDPDGVLGQVPILFVVSNEKFQRNHLIKHIRSMGNSFMIPHHILQIQEIPKNYMGKTDRKALLDIWFRTNGKKEESICDFSNQVMELMLTRRSIRHFTEEQIDLEILKKLVHVASMAPSGHNMQTWRFTVINNISVIKKIKETTYVVAKEKKTLFYGFNNPAALIIVSNDRRNPDAIQDSSAAIENILLFSHALRLGACWINSWIAISDEPRIREIMNELKIPPTHIVHGIVALGHPANSVKMPVKKENVVVYIE